MRFGSGIKVISISASLLAGNVSAAPLDLLCEYETSGLATNLILSIIDTTSSSSGSVEFKSGKIIKGKVEVSSKKYVFEGGDSEFSAWVSVSRDDGSATIRTKVGNYDFYGDNPKCSKYSGTKF